MKDKLKLITIGFLIGSAIALVLIYHYTKKECIAYERVEMGYMCARVGR